MDDLNKIHSELKERGIVKIKGLIDANLARDALGKVLVLAKEHGVYSDGKWTKSQTRFGYAKPFRNALIKLNKSERFPKLVGDQLTPLIERLVGAQVTPMSPGQQILFSLPSDESWLIPHDVWHTDLPKLAERTTPGLQAFTFLDDVKPRGGGTLIVAGSHRLLREHSVLSSKEVKGHLRKEKFFKTLFDPQRPAIEKLGEAVGYVGDVKLEVVELTGSVGDIYLMDLRVLHTPAPNCADKARLMLTCRFPRSAIAAQLANANLLK